MVGCRRIIGLDGSFIRGACEGKILAALGKLATSRCTLCLRSGPFRAQTFMELIFRALEARHRIRKLRAANNCIGYAKGT